MPEKKMTIANKTTFRVLFGIGVLLIAILEYINHSHIEIQDASFLGLLILMVLAVTVSIHGLLDNYWVASILGALLCFLPMLASLYIEPGKFGFALALPGLLIYFVSVYIFSLLAGLPVQRLKR